MLPATCKTKFFYMLHAKCYMQVVPFSFTCYIHTCYMLHSDILLHNHIPTCPHMARLRLQLGCCFFSKRKLRKSASFNWLQLASPDLEAVVRRWSRRLRKSRPIITGAVIDAALCGTINSDPYQQMKFMLTDVISWVDDIIELNVHTNVAVVFK